MNEQERLQRIINILADNAHEMCTIDGGSNDIILDVDMDGVQMVAKEITAIFKPSQKDTRSRRERALDAKFERMGVKPCVYHFIKDIEPFNAVTIATEKHALSIISGMLTYVRNSYVYSSYPPATVVFKWLQNKGVYGIAICDKHDSFKKRTGRMKAKGRLMQHLLWVGKK